MVKIIDSINLSNIESFITDLDNRIFKSLKDGKNECNLLLIKIKTDNDIFHYIKHSNGTIEPLSESMLSILLTTMKLAENKLCSFTVNTAYINEKYEDSNISLVLFSKNVNPRTQISKYLLCGLLFLKDLDNKNIFIPLICCKPSIGSVFMLLAEKLAKMLGYTILTLNSMADPLGFYIHKGYSLKDGDKIYELPTKSKIHIHKRIGDEITSSYQDILKHAGYLNNTGHITSFNNRARTLTRKVQNKLTRTQQKALNTPINILSGVSTNTNGHLRMYKYIRNLNKSLNKNSNRGRGRGRGKGSTRGKGKGRTRGRGRGGPSY